MNNNNNPLETLGVVVAILARIEKHQEDHGDQLAHIERRMDTIEKKVAVHSAIGGGITALAIGTGIELIKAHFFPGTGT